VNTEITSEILHVDGGPAPGNYDPYHPPFPALSQQADSDRPAALAVLTKGGLVAVTKSLAIEYASRGLRVNAVSGRDQNTGSRAANAQRPRHQTRGTQALCGVYSVTVE
jgi:NAD(P)-dependent dehydrogenase (short-subunit alcohol dehydrogenase family)